MRAVPVQGELRVDDPYGIVVAAACVAPSGFADHVEGCPPWVRAPLAAWLDVRGVAPRPFGYRVDGADMKPVVVTRL